VIEAGSLPREWSEEIGTTKIGELVGAFRMDQYVECAALRQKFSKHSMCAKIVGVNT